MSNPLRFERWWAMPLTLLFRDSLLVDRGSGEAIVHFTNGASLKISKSDTFSRLDTYRSFTGLEKIDCHFEADINALPGKTHVDVLEGFDVGLSILDILTKTHNAVAVLAQSQYNRLACLEVGKLLTVQPLAPFDTASYEVGIIASFTLI